MILIDTNVLARLMESKHLQHHAARESIKLLGSQQTIIYINPQVLIEFYAIATRPSNSLHLSPDEALIQIQNIKARFPLLTETPDLFPQWENLIAQYKPTNRRVFDARHVACMLVHKIPTILTFNDKDFLPYAEIKVLNPFDVLNLARV